MDADIKRPHPFFKEVAPPNGSIELALDLLPI